MSGAGTWRTAGRAWRVLVPTVLALALVQALAVWPGPTPAFAGWFVALAVGSFAAAAAALALAAVAAGAAASGRAFAWPRWPVWVAAAAIVLVVAAAGAVSPFLGIAAAALGLVVAPAVADGVRNPLRWFGAFRAAPVAASFLALGTLVAVLALWAGAFALGLFFLGPLGAALTWLGFGAIGATLLCAWTVLHRRDA